METSDPHRGGLPAVLVGFDSAWGDRARGAVCSVAFDGDHLHDFRPPGLVGFKEAAEFVLAVRRSDRATVVAIDQPTVVPNAAGMRPADRVAASVVSWMGGGVQPANTGRPFFADDAPIWKFIESVGAARDPDVARTAIAGVHAVEVFPALSLAALDGRFCGRLKGPRYNPARRKTFRLSDWTAVVEAVGAEAARLGFADLGAWLESSMPKEKPRKEHQDMLDSAVCLLVALRWRLRPRGECVMVGDVETGHVVAASAPAVRERLAVAAAKVGAPMDGIPPKGPTGLGDFAGHPVTP